LGSDLFLNTGPDNWDYTRLLNRYHSRIFALVTFLSVQKSLVHSQYIFTKISLAFEYQRYFHEAPCDRHRMLCSHICTIALNLHGKTACLIYAHLDLFDESSSQRTIAAEQITLKLNISSTSRSSIVSTQRARLRTMELTVTHNVANKTPRVNDTYIRPTMPFTALRTNRQHAMPMRIQYYSLGTTRES
jgi:hypothetical protein